jgi:transposase, IS5 family
MLAVVPWDAHVARIAPFAPAGTTGRPPYPVLLLLRVHFLQQWFSLADEAAREALYDIPVYRAFAGIDPGATGIPDVTTILRFRHLPGRHALALLQEVNAVLGARGLMVRRGTLVDATISRAPNATKNQTGTRDPEVHQTRKGNQWFFGMKAHIGFDADSGLVHTVVATPANVHDLAVAGSLLHGGEAVVHGDSGYRGVARWCDTPGVAWMVAVPLPRNRQRKEGAGGASTDDALSDRGEAGCQISL